MVMLADHRICRGHLIHANPAGRSLTLSMGYLIYLAARIAFGQNRLYRGEITPGHHGGFVRRSILCLCCEHIPNYRVWVYAR